MVQSIRQNPAYRLVGLTKRPLAKFCRGPFILLVNINKPSKMSRLTISLASSTYLFLACASHTPSPETTPNSSQPPPAEPGARTGSPNTAWEFSPSEQTNTYRSTSYMIVHEGSNMRTRTDTLKLDTRFTISLNQLQTPTTISGYIESAAITQSNQSESQLNNSSSRIGFNGEITGSELTLKLLTNSTDCTSPISSILGEIRSAIASHPRAISLASVWTDSTSTITCSGNGIPTTLTVVRSYRVLGETTYSRTRALIIERTEATHFSGSGSQEQHQVQIEGAGAGTSKIYLDTRNGAIIAVESTQRIETAIRASGRLRHYTQDITQKVELVP
jgi:hypothetical protein